MEGFSIWHWIVFLFMLFLIIYPCWKIAAKAGFSGWWSLLSFIPFINLVLLWMFALVDWPVKAKQSP